MLLDGGEAVGRLKEVRREADNLVIELLLTVAVPATLGGVEKAHERLAGLVGERVRFLRLDGSVHVARAEKKSGDT